MANTVIESEKKTINAPSEEVFNFLCDFNNIVRILPADKISNWQSSADDCSFKIQGAATIALIKDSVESPNKINIVSGDKSPFPFTLVVEISSLENQKCESYLVFNGEINAFLKMMVVSPLTNLFNYMAHKLQSEFNVPS